VDGDETVFFYRFHRDSFNMCLRTLCLVYEYEVPPATLVSDLLYRVVDDMKDCALKYSFVVKDTHAILDHESLPLLLLSFVNRGRVRTSDGQIRMRRSPVTEDMTLESMTNSRHLYSPTSLDFCVENGRFIVHASTSFNQFLITVLTI
jgi:hypothetical protein